MATTLKGRSHYSDAPLCDSEPSVPRRVSEWLSVEPSHNSRLQQNRWKSAVAVDVVPWIKIQATPTTRHLFAKQPGKVTINATYMSQWQQSVSDRATAILLLVILASVCWISEII